MKKETMQKVHKVLMWLLGILTLCAVCRTTHYYIETYTDNSVNDYSIVNVETDPNTNLKN